MREQKGNYSGFSLAGSRRILSNKILYKMLLRVYNHLVESAEADYIMIGRVLWKLKYKTMMKLQ